MNLYSRVERGDVNQCSFGFEILSEETDFRDDGTVHFTITEVRLHEVSVCTFPAYAETSVQARKEDRAHEEERLNEIWRAEMRARLKGENNA